MKPKHIKGSGILPITLDLIEQLSGHKSGISRTRFMAEHGIDEASLEQVLDIVATLADRESGARTIVEQNDDQLVFAGNAGAIKPLRLTLAEGLTLSSILQDAELPSEVRNRIESALIPPSFASVRDVQVADRNPNAAIVQQLHEAIDYGIRCILSYRSQNQAEASSRTIDPLLIESLNGIVYLRAFDVSKGEERSYRIDRIHSVSFTDESVSGRVASGSLSKDGISSGELVELITDTSYAELRSWRGIESVEPRGGDATKSRILLRVSSKPWLFDQILASQGQARIDKPKNLVEEFVRYAKGITL